MKAQIIIAVICLLIGGTVLVLDEMWMFVPGFGSPGWLIGDWSWAHISPIHHWMIGLAMFLTGFALLYWRDH